MMKQVLDDQDFGIDGTGCGNCMRSFDCGEEGFVACGANAADRPIWALRQERHLKDLLILKDEPLEEEGYTGRDDERMRVDDGGRKCPAYSRRA